MRSINTIVAIGRALLVLLLSNIPYLLILGVIAAVVLWIRKKKQKS